MSIVIPRVFINLMLDQEAHERRVFEERSEMQ